MAIIMHRFLCLCDIRLGSAIVSLYTLIMSMASVAWYLCRYIIWDQKKGAEEFAAVMHAAFAIYSAMIISSVVLLVGVLKNCRKLFWPWMVMIILVLLFDTGAIALLTTLHLDSNKFLSGWDIGAIIIYVVRMISNIYCMLCVHSQYHVLSEQRKRDKNLRRSPSVSCIDGSALEMDPPPYSIEDPMKDSCPPSYDNAALDSSI